MRSVSLRTLLTLVGWMPTPAARAAGRVLGLSFWLFRHETRWVAEHHFARLFPDAPSSVRRRLALRSLQAFACSVIESQAIWFGPRKRLLHWLDAPASAAKLRSFDREGNGVIVLCPHIGSWELAGMFCAHHGGITSMYKPQSGAIDALMLEGRCRLGARLVPSDAGGVRALLTALRRGERVGILPDQDPPWASGEFAPLFGVAAHTPVLVQRLARRTGATVIYCYAERVGWRRFRWHIVPAADAGRSLEGLNASVERCILHLPDQYWWSYRRFRRRPDGQPDFYARW